MVSTKFNRRSFLQAAGAAGGSGRAVFRDFNLQRVQAAQRRGRGQVAGRRRTGRILLAADPDGFRAGPHDHQFEQRLHLPHLAHGAGIGIPLSANDQHGADFLSIPIADRIQTIRVRMAHEFGCDPEEMALTRGASESLQIVQNGIDLKPGDEVLTTDQDYPRMLTTWDQRMRRDGHQGDAPAIPRSHHGRLSLQHV